MLLKCRGLIVPQRAFFRTLYDSDYKSHATDSFLSSKSATYVNLCHHVVASDIVSQTFDAETLSGLDDRKVLSLFTLGFFGGFIFSIERLLLKAGAWRILPVGFSSFPHTSQETEIWNTSQLLQNGIFSTGTQLFGVFQLLDRQLADSSTCLNGNIGSYVDYGFGSDIFSFAGCHRFRITRLHSTAEHKKAQVQISLEGFHCNPQRNQLSMPAIASWFHSIYARALFANGIQSVLNGRPDME